MTKPKNTGITRLIKAVGYSQEGLKAAFETEAAFRQELALCAVLMPLVFAFDVTSVERAVMLGSLFLVLIVEIVNTGFESTIERISSDIHPLSKKAKDLGSAAVLLACINAGVVWAVILVG